MMRLGACAYSPPRVVAEYDRKKKPRILRVNSDIFLGTCLRHILVWLRQTQFFSLQFEKKDTV